MPNCIVRYLKQSDLHTTYLIRAPIEVQLQELCTLDDGYTYVSVPAGTDLSDQLPQVTVEPVTLTPELREKVKAASPQCELIARLMQDRIRAFYSVEDEAYFARIGVGVALGAYAFEPGEQDALLSFGAHVESVRQWGREQRAKLGV